jgi:3-hydroxyisobutyrate dehydrogenase-like beta-hydroxyacid dehydrogenase
VIVVVGLGNIGLAIGQRLDEAQDAPVVGVEPSRERRDLWTASTYAVAVPDLDGVEWDEVRLVVVVVRLTEQVDAVLADLAGRADAARPFAVWIVTTLEPGFAAGLDRFVDVGRIIELPVSGGDRGAREGTLTAMAAGPLTDADRAAVRLIAPTLVEFGSYGEPTLAKLVNNVLGAYNAAAFAAMVQVADDLGVAPERIREVVRTSSGGSWMVGAFMDLLDDLLAKDVALLSARVGGLPAVAVDVGPGELAAQLDAARALLGARVG